MKKLRFLLIMVTTLVMLCQSSYGQDDILFRRHLVKSGWHGLFYGLAMDVIFEIDGAAAAGIPVITAGGSVVAPLLLNSSKSIDFDMLVLTGHGKSLGWAHGFALSALIFGEDLFGGEEEDITTKAKISVGIGALSSIGGGLLGKGLAKNNVWSEGRVELYRHYGWVMPFAGFSVMAATVDDIRLAAAGVLVSGAGGYLLADRISDWNDFTRGEVRATQTLTSLNMGLGFGIMADVVGEGDPKRGDMLFPAAGALLGMAAGHLYTRNTGFTAQQGMLTAYSAAGGAIIGFGVALLLDSENITPWYLIPYATGLGSYITAVEVLRRQTGVYSYRNGNGGNNFHVDIMPQNFFLNNKILENGNMLNGRYVGMQPLFSASLKF
jgi:hypothetical protein